MKQVALFPELTHDLAKQILITWRLMTTVIITDLWSMKHYWYSWWRVIWNPGLKNSVICTHWRNVIPRIQHCFELSWCGRQPTDMIKRSGNEDLWLPVRLQYRYVLYDINGQFSIEIAMGSDTHSAIAGSMHVMILRHGLTIAADQLL